MKTGTKGALLASAVAMMFLASSVRAQEGGPAVGSSPNAKSASVKCVAGNDCKGQSSCKGASNDCKGQNACKGKGFVMAASPDECKSKGGHVEKM